MSCENICEECPVQQAYAEFVVQSNTSGNGVNFYEIGEELTLDDFMTFKAMITEAKKPTWPTWPDKFRVVMDDTDCPGPKKEMLGFGKLSCRGTIDFIKENRHFEIVEE